MACAGAFDAAASSSAAAAAAAASGASSPAAAAASASEALVGHRSSSQAGEDLDEALLVKLREAIGQDNPAAIACIEAVVRDGGEAQWDRLYSQLESRHQAYIQLKRQRQSDELQELQALVRRNLATERRLLDEQLANHRGAIAAGNGNGHGQSDADDRADLHETTSVSWKGETGLSTTSLGDRLSSEQPHHHHLHRHGHHPDSSSDAAAAQQLRAALAERERDLSAALDRLARSRRHCDVLLGRLTAAEAELQFLRNRRLAGGRSDVAVADPDADASSAASVRRSLAELERRHLIEDTADALDLPGEPAALEQRYDCLQVERRELEAALARVPAGPGSLHHSWHSARDRELLEKKLDNIDRELVHLRNNLKQFQLI